MKLLELTLSILLVSGLFSTAFSQDAAKELNGKWLLTEVYSVGFDGQRVAGGAETVKEKLIVKNELVYQFKDMRMTIFANGDPVIYYDISMNEKGDMTVPEDDEINDLIRGLKLISVTDDQLELEIAAPDGDSEFVYRQVFSRQ